MNLGPHASFIIAAYVIAVLVVAGLIVWIELDNRTQRRKLARLAAQGVTRRAGKSA
jgi:heme exporter protein D